MKKNLKVVREFDGRQSPLSMVSYWANILVGSIVRSFAKPHCRTLGYLPSGLPLSVDAIGDSLPGPVERNEVMSPLVMNDVTSCERRTFFGWFTAFLFIASSRTSSADHPLPFDSAEGTDFSADVPKTLADLNKDANFLIENKSKIENAIESIQFGSQFPNDAVTAAIARVICRKNLESEGSYLKQIQAAIAVDDIVGRLVELVQQKNELADWPNPSENQKAYEYLVDIELLEVVSSLVVPLELASLFRRSD